MFLWLYETRFYWCMVIPYNMGCLDLIALDIHSLLTIRIIVNFQVFFLKSLTHRYGALGLKGQKF